MEQTIGINATLGDLDLISAIIDADEKLLKVYEVFKKNPTYPGLLLTRNGELYRMLSKARFYEVMSKQYMFDLFSHRPAHFFFDDNFPDSYLILDVNTSVLNAATLALQRPIKSRFDPIIVNCAENCYKLLDYYTLLLAQNQVHLQTAQLLGEANEFKKEVLGIVAHDLRNPISAILGFVKLIERHETLQELDRKYIGFIYESSLQMHNLVNDFLVTAINDATDFRMNPARFEIVRLVNQIITYFKEPSEKKDQKILLVHSHSEIYIIADAQKIREVIENLISNAIKYTGHRKQIKIFIECQNSMVNIKVSDEGPGLSDNDKEKIFGKFARLSAKPTDGETSTGLGLYIVKKLVDLHKGKIWAESKPGEGSTFIVELPLGINEMEKEHKTEKCN
jgi:signal transduction histidine kinase